MFDFIGRIFRRGEPKREAERQLTELAAANTALRDEVTRRERAEADLREQREWFRAALSSIADAVIVTDAGGYVTYVNPTAATLTGWPAAEAVGRPLDDVYRTAVGSSEQPPASSAGRALASGRTQRPVTDTPLVARDGTIRPVEDTAAPLRDETGEVLGAVLVFRDVTDRRRSEQALRQSEERMRSVVNHVIDGIITIDDAGTVQSMNPAAERTFGYAATEVVSRNVNMLMPDPYRSEHDGYLGNYLQTGQPKIIGIGREVEGRRKDGSTFPMDLAVSEFRIGPQRYFTGIVRDITDRKRMEDELRQRVRELADADRRKDEFLAMLAHELRNPLAPVRNAVHIMSMIEPSDANLRWARDVVGRQVGHMSRLVDDLLDISRISRGMISLQTDVVDLAAVVERAVETSRPLLDARGHDLTVRMAPGPILVRGDLTRLAQVFANLLNNAAKYTPDGGWITVTVHRDDSTTTVRVTDTGVGIAAELLPRVFDLFTQADRSLDRAQGGLGIGLSLVKTLVELHGGAVEVQSGGAGKGSEFVVRLPVVVSGSVPDASPERSGRPIEASQTNRPGDVLRVLVVDDNTDAATSMAMLLRAVGHVTEAAHDGPTAVAAADRFKPNVVLLDIGLPGMDGYEVARRLRATEDGQRRLLVAVTGYGGEEVRRLAAEAGFDRHLVKPVDPEDVHALLRAAGV